MLRKGGHAVDAAAATALCVGVVNPMASGIGGGAFMIVQSSSTSKTEAYDMRETAPLAASQVYPLSAAEVNTQTCSVDKGSSLFLDHPFSSLVELIIITT